MTKTVPAADLAANLDALLDEITEKQEEVVVTRDGREVAKVVPLPIAEELRGPMYGTIRIIGDIVAPMDIDCDLDR